MTGRAAAARYARALFDVALTEGTDLDALARELSDVAQLLADNPPLGRVLTNPAIPAPRKRAVMEQLLARSPVSPVLSRLLLLLADRDRLILTGDLAEAFSARVMEHRHVIRAELTTAMALPADRVAAIRQGLARATRRGVQDVQLDTRVDPSIIGGAVTRIGSTVYDGSVTRQLARMRQKLVENV
jgi:F-type H+-transporting ATPase subunit delta